MLALLISGLFATDPSVALVEVSSARTHAILGEAAPRSERLANLRNEIERVADWAIMAQRSAGAEWQSMTEPERRRFIAAFSQLLISSHLSNLENMEAGPLPTIRAGERISPEETWVDVVIPNRFFPLTVGFLVRNNRRIVDVRVPGFRLTEHFQETLRLSVQRWGRSGTLERLEQKAAAAERRLTAR
ncbi:MAG: ABC transporter substrate-binding protein [Myxococcota bacterium]